MSINVTLRGGSGDMLKSTYDPNLDGVIALAELDTLINKLSSLSIDANLSMGAHDISLGAGQLVDGKDVGFGCVAHDVEVTDSHNVYTLVKTITLTKKRIGDLWVYFEMKHSTGGATAYGRVYKTGVAVGTAFGGGDTAWVAYTEKIAFGTLDIGNTIQLYTYPDSGVGASHVRNFRVYGGVEGTI